MELFPNPATSVVRVVLNASFQSGTLRFYNIQGKLVKQMPLMEGVFEYDIDLNGLTPGTYLVLAGLDGSQFSQKLIVE